MFWNFLKATNSKNYSISIWESEAPLPGGLTPRSDKLDMHVHDLQHATLILLIHNFNMCIR